MNAKVLSSLTAALVVTSFVPPAIAEPLGEHPAVVVAQTWNNRGIDPNTFIVAHPASTRWVDEAPKAADKLAHASETSKLHWSAAIGTGDAARNTTNTFHGVPASPHWTATIGSGTAATSTSAAPNTKSPLSAGAQPVVGAAHWTSKIGSGHPFDSTNPVVYTSVANSR